MIGTIIGKTISIRLRKKIIKIISCDCFTKENEIFIENYIQVKKILVFSIGWIALNNKKKERNKIYYGVGSND